MVQRHIREGTNLLVRQRRIVASLPPDSDSAKIARQLLARFEEAQKNHQDHLARLLR